MNFTVPDLSASPAADPDPLGLTDPCLLETLVVHRFAVSPDTSIEAAVKAIQRERVNFAAVVDGDRLVGQLVRIQLDEKLATRFGFALYARRPVVEVLGRQPLIVTLGEPFNDVLAAVTARSGEAFHDDVVLVDTSGRFLGYIPVHALMQLQHRLLQQKLDRLATLTESLNGMNRELALSRDSALAAARAKSDFLANMSHEIRTPMNGVIGMANLLMGTPLTSEQRDLAKTLCDCGESLLTIINDILDFSKIDAGHLELEAVDFILDEQLRVAVDLHTEAAQRKGLELVMSIDPTIPACVRGDPVRLRQIVLNLLGNAIKFTPGGEVALSVSLKENRSVGCVLLFEITDTGIGISPAVQATLFRPFVQADSSTTRNYGGTGLGLAISKRLCALMGGEIGVLSEPGHGSTFWFTVQFGHAAPDPVPCESAAPPIDRRRTLIVDDNATNRKLLSHLCVAWGLRHRAVDSADAALAALAQGIREGDAYDLVLLDHHMPKRDGLDLARVIAAEPGLAAPLLVMLTSRGERMTLEELAVHGLAACELKPIHPRKLRACLVQIVAESAAGAGRLRLPIPRQPLPLPSSGAAQILLTEDNLVNQKVTLLQLRNLGYPADVAANGYEAIAALRRKSYALVLMDAQMPQMDGLEATRQIRAAQARGEEGFPSYLPIIAMTANAMTGDREACLEAGMDDYLAKPVRAEALAAALARHLRLAPVRPAELALTGAR